MEQLRTLPRAPAELTAAKLERLGEGIGNVVYASEHWVVKRERSPSEVAALIVLWKVVRKWEQRLPFGLGKRLLDKPSRQIRFLRVLTQAAMVVVPKALWFSSHVKQLWRQYYVNDIRGSKLARERLAGTDLIPEQVIFPPVRVKVGGWPGWLTVTEATERVEDTLFHRLGELSREGRYEQVEMWMTRLLETRQIGWRRGLFSTDAHLKNFGIIGERVVLIDPGGLTNRWADVERHLTEKDQSAEPHVRLGLGPLLECRPDVAERFNARWRAVVNVDRVMDLWPG